MPAFPQRSRRSGPRPLSRRASRLFVIGMLVLIVAIAVAGSVYLVQTAEQAQQRREQQEGPTTPDAAPADSISL